MMKKLFLVLSLAVLTAPVHAQTINNLAAGSAVQGTDMFPAYQGANPARRVTADQIKTYVNAGDTPVPANPTAQVGTAAVNGAASTFMRSDAAPAINQAIVPTWTGIHTFNGSTGTLTPGIILGGTNPDLRWRADNGAVDNKIWTFGVVVNSATLSTFRMAALKDSGSGKTGDAFITATANLTEINHVGLRTATASLDLTETSYGAGSPGISSNSGANPWAHTGAFSATGDITTTAGVAGNTTVTAGIGSNSVQMTGAPNGSDPVIQALGVTDANVSVQFKPKGTGILKLVGPVTVSDTVNGMTITGVVADAALINQAADASNGTVYAVPADGIYRASCYVVLTQAATTSATVPGCTVSYTDPTTNVAMTSLAFASSVGNTVGTHLNGSVVLEAKSGTNIGYSTTGYASGGATPMQYRVRVVLERVK